MKAILYSILFLLVPKFCIAQISENDKMVYLDSTWNETTKENHKYYRIIKDYYKDKDLYKINDFYKSGVLQMEGSSITKEGTSKEGEFIFYYENGNKKAVTNYIKSRPNGKCFEWYENGDKKLEGEYIEGEKNFAGELKVAQFWDAKGDQTVINGYGNYEEISEFFFAAGKIKEGFKDGRWEGYDKKIGYTFREKYENKKFKSGTSKDSNQVSRKYKIVELRPEFKNGIADFYKHVAKNFRLPNVSGLKGKIYISFVIDKSGNVVKPKIVKGLGFGSDEEVIRVLSSYRNFLPGQIRGITVDCKYSLPISIQS